MPVPSFTPLVEYVWPAPAGKRRRAGKNSCTIRAAPPVRVEDHALWCRGVVTKMAEQLRCWGQEREDLIAVALLCMTKMAQRFDPARVPAGGDPGGQFRGWCHPAIKKEVQREAIRLRNAGAYNTRREWEHTAPIVSEGLPTARQPDGTVEVMLEAREEAPDPAETQRARLEALTTPELYDALHLARGAAEVIKEILEERGE